MPLSWSLPLENLRLECFQLAAGLFPCCAGLAAGLLPLPQPCRAIGAKAIHDQPLLCLERPDRLAVRAHGIVRRSFGLSGPIEQFLGGLHIGRGRRHLAPQFVAVGIHLCLECLGSSQIGRPDKFRRRPALDLRGEGCDPVSERLQFLPRQIAAEALDRHLFGLNLVLQILPHCQASTRLLHALQPQARQPGPQEGGGVFEEVGRLLQRPPPARQDPQPHFAADHHLGGRGDRLRLTR